MEQYQTISERLKAAMLYLLTLTCVAVWAGVATAEVRIKDIASFEGVRENHLIGYGLVVGLLGTGDKMANSPFTRESVRGMLERLGVANIDANLLQTKNTAAVMVTAKLPPFSRRGAPIDVTVSSLGDSTSLRGGTLLVTPLAGADGEVYAVAQGAVAVSGFRAEGAGATLTEGVPTIARIDNGAIVEREVGFSLDQMKSVRVALRTPDFTTATRVRDVVNTELGAQFAEVLDLLINSEGEDGLRHLFQEVAEATPDLLSRLAAHDMVLHYDLDLDGALARHYPELAVGLGQ